MIDGGTVRVTTVVALDPAAAFAVFTGEIGAWRKPRVRLFRGDRDGTLRFEGGAGGRLVEVYGDGDAPFEVGRALAWQPGERLVFEWRQRSRCGFRPRTAAHG